MPETYSTNQLNKVSMNIPENLKYTEDHEWIEVEGDVAVVGITEYAQEQLGDVVFVEIETEGESIEKGDAFGTIEAVKTVSDLFMPIAGEVTEVNPKLEETPEIVNQDPFGDGWMVKIKMSNPDDANELLSADEYKDTIG